jgi:urease accessory protein UreH
VLAGDDRWGGLGLAQGRPYFGSVLVVTDAGLDDFLADLPEATTVIAGTTADAARLARRGALVRCLAADAPALGDVLAAVWTLARGRVLGLPPLSLRKL